MHALVKDNEHGNVFSTILQQVNNRDFKDHEMIAELKIYQEEERTGRRQA